MPIPGHGTPAAPAAPAGTTPATPAAGTTPTAPTPPPPGGPTPTTTPVQGGVDKALEIIWAFLFPLLIAVGVIVGHFALHHEGWRNWWVGGLCGFAVAAILWFMNQVRDSSHEDVVTPGSATAPAPATPAPVAPAAPSAPVAPGTPTNPGLAGQWTDPATSIVWYWDLTRWHRWDPSSRTWV